MADPSSTDLRELLPQLTADAARELAREQDAEGDARKRRARALYAYADALDGDMAPTPAEIATSPANGTSSVTTGGDTPHPDPEQPDQSGERAGAAPPSNKRPLIWAAIEDAPLPGWSAARVREILVQWEQIPPETTRAAINVTLRRMYLDGQLAKTPDGLYTTPQHGQLHDPPDEPNPFAEDGLRVVAPSRKTADLGAFALPN